MILIIIKEIATNIVIYNLNDDASVELLAGGLIVNGVTSLDISSLTHVKETGVNNVSRYRGGAYSYDNGVWGIGNASIYNDVLTDAKINKVIDLATKSTSLATEDLTTGGVTFTADNKSVADITTALSVMGRNPTDTIDFRGVNGWAVATKAALENMQNAVWQRRKAVNANTKAHEDAIALLTTPQSVVDYDITTGWPV